MDHPPIQIKFLFLNYEVIMRSQLKKRHSAFLGCCRTEDRWRRSEGRERRSGGRRRSGACRRSGARRRSEAPEAPALHMSSIVVSLNWNWKIKF